MTEALWGVGIGVGLLVLTLLGTVLAGLFGARSRRLSRLVRAKHVSIADATDGALVKLEGRVSDKAEPVPSRVNGEPIVCSHLELTYRTRSSRFFELNRHAPFVIEDDTGEAAISVEALTVGYAERMSTGRLEGETLVGWAKEAIEADGVTFASEVPGGRLDITEQSIAPGDRIAVLGVARWAVASDGDGGGPRQAPRRLTIEPHPELGVVVSAHRHAFD